MCQVLVANDFMRWWQLGKAPDPSQWQGATELQEEELEFLRKIKTCERKRPRYILFALCAWTCCMCVWECACFRAPSPEKQQGVDVLKYGTVDCLRGCRPINTDGAAVGPRDALKKRAFGDMSPGARAAWAEKARVDAILGGMRLSMASLRSGLRCYTAFVGTAPVVAVVVRKWLALWAC